jgi:methylmalonyl-CoA/ethylmalonyl-CoA epimerase
MTAMMEGVPGFLCIDHIAIAVAPGELERQVEMYKRMGFTEVHREDVLGDDQVREVLLQVGFASNRIQLLEPLTGASPVAKQLERNGGRGVVAHIAFQVADIYAAFVFMKQNGFHIIDPAPRKGSRGTMVFFVHPKTTADTSFGYLVEVVQPSSE